MQNSPIAMDSTTNKSSPSSPQHLPTDKPQSGDATNPSLVQNTGSSAAATVEGGRSGGGEGGRGRGEPSENISIPGQVLELKSGEGGDDGQSGSLLAVAMGDAVQKPMAEEVVSTENPTGGPISSGVPNHKRKPSKGIDTSQVLPSCHICKTKFPNRKSVFNHMRALHPNSNSHSTGRQLNDKSLHQERGEGNEKVKGNEGSPSRGLRGLDLNQQVEEVNYSSNHVAQETKVKPFVGHEIEVEPSAAEKDEVKASADMQKNEVESSAVDGIEVEPYPTENSEVKASSVVEKNEVKPSARQGNEVEPSAADEIEVEPYPSEKDEVQPSVVEKNEVKPSAIEKNEVEPSAVDEIEVEPYPTEMYEVKASATKKNEVEESSLTEKNDDFIREAKTIKFDLNELPADEDEN